VAYWISLILVPRRTGLPTFNGCNWMVKLVVQVPCLNEETTLPLVFALMPRSIPGIDSIEFLIVDDGSTDRTVEVAASLGVTEFVHHTRNMGLGQSFRDGARRALELGADILVNTDGDNQYPSERIPDLVRPILLGEADIVVGDRQTDTIPHFSLLKKRLQRIGSGVVNLAAGTEIPDAASGFRAYSREALVRLNTINRFSYCTETIIQAGYKRLAIRSIPIQTNAKTRESRLFSNITEHVMKSAAAILRAYIMYRPLRLFTVLGSFMFVLGLLPFLRYVALVLFTNDNGGAGRHIQSLVLGGVFLIAAVIMFALGLIAELTRINRALIEDSLEQQKRHVYPNEPARYLSMHKSSTTVATGDPRLPDGTLMIACQEISAP
jgi:glycosyltransferase involved in cell wall biosynthesis